MKIEDYHPHVLTPLEIEVSFQELVQKINASRPHPELLKTAKKTLAGVHRTWQPAAVCRWLDFRPAGAGTTGHLSQNGRPPLEIDFGFPCSF